MNELLTIQQIAEKLDMPPSTVRYYKNKFKEFMPEVLVGRYAKFKPEAVEIIETIAAATAATKQQQEIKELLAAKFALNIGQSEECEPTAATATTTAATTQQQPDFNIKAHYKLLAQANSEIINLRSVLQQMIDANRILREENRELTKHLLQIKAPAPQRKFWGLWRKKGDR